MFLFLQMNMAFCYHSDNKHQIFSHTDASFGYHSDNKHQIFSHTDALQDTIRQKYPHVQNFVM